MRCIHTFDSYTFPLPIGEDMVHDDETVSRLNISVTSWTVPFSFAAFIAASSAFFFSLNILSSSSSSFFSFLALYSTSRTKIRGGGVRQTFKGFNFPPCRDIRTLL